MLSLLRELLQALVVTITRCYEHVFISLLEALIKTTYNIQCNTRRCVREQQQNVQVVRKYRQSLCGRRLGSSQLINRIWLLAKHPAFVCAFRCQGNYGGYRDTQHLYALFSSAKYLILSTYSRCKEYAGMQRVIIFFFSQSQQKSIKLQLLQL